MAIKERRLTKGRLSLCHSERSFAEAKRGRRSPRQFGIAGSECHPVSSRQCSVSSRACPSRRKQILVFAAVAAFAMCIGYSQTLGRYTWPPLALVLWFPWAVIAFRLSGGEVLWMAIAGLLQYPLLTTAFGTGIYRWRSKSVLIAVCCLHAATLASVLTVYCMQQRVTSNQSLERTAGRFAASL